MNNVELFIGIGVVSDEGRLLIDIDSDRSDQSYVATSDTNSSGFELVETGISCFYLRE